MEKVSQLETCCRASEPSRYFPGEFLWKSDLYSCGWFLNITPTCNYIARISVPFIFFSAVRTKDSEKLSGNNCRPVLNCGQVVARRWAGMLLLWKQGWFLMHALCKNNKSLKSTNSQLLLSLLSIFSTNFSINLG